MAEQASDEVGLGDARVEISDFPKYAGSAGKTDRIAIISGALKRVWRYYHESSKKTFRAPESPETLRIVKSVLGEPDQRFGLVVFHYTTDENGTLLDNQKCSGKVKVWSITETRYSELSRIHATWPILDSGFGAQQVDLILACEDEKYQKIKFMPAPEAHWKRKQGWYDALKAKETKAKEKLDSVLGKRLTDAEIIDALGLAPRPTMGAQMSSDVDLSGILDEALD